MTTPGEAAYESVWRLQLWFQEWHLEMQDIRIKHVKMDKIELLGKQR